MSAISSGKRIESIDLLRGVAMIIMALDHVRDYVHISANTDDPLNLATTSPWLFFTRWITHFCAPIFVFLSGTSVYLQGKRKSPKELGSFLIKRGLWLIVVEWTLVAFAWTFNPTFPFIPFQVIWAIGICMLITGLLIYAGIKYQYLVALGFILVLAHNLLDIPESRPGFTSNFWWDLLHHGGFNFYPVFDGHQAVLVYPFIPWLGLMLLGYGLGRYYERDVSQAQRKRWLLRMGLGIIVFFILLRMTNVYGDPLRWSVQDHPLKTLGSFLNNQKYPPSLLYICMTIGPALLLLAITERAQGWLSRVFVVFGRTAFFYYILHLYLIHTIAVILYFVRGHQLSELPELAKNSLFLFVVRGEGFFLPGTYLVWLLVILILYPVCASYNRYKSAHKEKWWLSYL